MKKTCIAAALCGALVAPQVFAQAGNFQGLSAGLGLNVADSTAEKVVAGFSNKGTDTDANFLLQLQYNLAVNEVLVLGFGGTVNFGDLKAGTLTPATPVKTKDAYSLYVAPGYAFNNMWLGYGKLAYLSANTDTLGLNTRFDGGYGVGFGVQALFGRRWFGQAEVMVNQYNDQSFPGESDRLKSNVFSLSAGYRF